MTIEANRASDTAENGPGCLDRLEGLAAALAAREFRTRRRSPGGRVPSLQVVNPAAAALAENVYAGPARDGGWWFWWSWAERIAAADDLAGAALLISRVLAAREETRPGRAPAPPQDRGERRGLRRGLHGDGQPVGDRCCSWLGAARPQQLRQLVPGHLVGDPVSCRRRLPRAGQVCAEHAVAVRRRLLCGQSLLQGVLGRAQAGGVRAHPACRAVRTGTCVASAAEMLASS